MPALLELDDVHVGYVEGIDILAGINLHVGRGAITGIIGPNGAGKSTLLRAIFGFLHPHRGRILLDGREIHAMAPHAIKRLGIGYVTQGANIFPRLRVEKNLLLGAWVLRRDRPRVPTLLERAYAAFAPLKECRARGATTPSRGEAKM